MQSLGQTHRRRQLLEGLRMLLAAYTHRFPGDYDLSKLSERAKARRAQWRLRRVDLVAERPVPRAGEEIYRILHLSRPLLDTLPYSKSTGVRR